MQFREQFRGYDPNQVDDAIEALAVRIENGGEVRRFDLDHPEFRQRLRGYHREDVDAFFEALRREAR